jgi:DNA-binding XRE family transcriptional regulator
MTEPIIIEHEGKPTHVVVPFAAWQRIKAALEDYEDAIDAAVAKRILEDPKTEWVPGEVVDRLVDGQNPIRVWREHRGLSQAALAARANLPQQTISMLESGRRKGTLDHVRRLAEALGVGLDDLVSWMLDVPAAVKSTARRRRTRRAGRQK